MIFEKKKNVISKFQKRSLRLLTMQRWWSTTECGFRSIELKNNHFNQRCWIWMQVSVCVCSVKVSKSRIFPNKNFILVFCFRSTSGPSNLREFTDNGLVRDGTPCGQNLVCVNQTCVSLFPYIDQTKCPTNSNNVECYGQGVSSPFPISKSITMFFDLYFHYWMELNLCRFVQIPIDVFVIMALLDLIARLLYQLQHHHQLIQHQPLIIPLKWKRRKHRMVSHRSWPKLNNLIESLFFYHRNSDRETNKQFSFFIRSLNFFLRIENKNEFTWMTMVINFNASYPNEEPWFLKITESSIPFTQSLLFNTISQF